LRIVIARLNHETNTFSPVPTPISAFSPRWGKEAAEAARGSATAMATFIEFAESLGAEIVTPVFATAFPSGMVSRDAYEALCSAILKDAASGCDAVLLDLHGAMVVEGHEDGEGALLERLREIVGTIPIGVALDLHANISAKMVRAADVIVGFKTYPHVDMVETGNHVAKIMNEIISGTARPVCVHHDIPILAQTLCMNTGQPGAMRDAIAAARAAEARAGVRAVSIFGGFPLSDIPEAGMSVVVVADVPAVAAEVCRDLAGLIWERRSDFIYREEPLERSIAAAVAAAEAGGNGPVLLLDHGDNCMSGGTCDVMDVLSEALLQGLDGIVAGPICDPEAIEIIYTAGQGADVEVEVGNRYDLSAIGNTAPPMRLHGRVRALSDGRYVIAGPTYRGMACEMGRCAVLDIGPAQVLISETTHEPWDIGVFTCAGIDPTACRYLVLKSRMYCRPVFEPLACAVIECASLGVTSSNYRLFPYSGLRRPIYPLESANQWQARFP